MSSFTLTTSTGLKRTAKASRPAGVLYSSSAGAEQTGSVVIERRPSYREYSELLHVTRVSVTDQDISIYICMSTYNLHGFVNCPSSLPFSPILRRNLPEESNTFKQLFPPSATTDMSS